MRKVFLFLSFILLPLILFRNSFNNFLAQDDFVLLNKFSQGSFGHDIWTVLSSYKDTHWRPIHNLFFFLTGKIFYKNFTYYHFFVFCIHLSVGFLIYRILLMMTKQKLLSFIASLVYITSSVHFVTLYWISGSATTIAMFFFLLSFNSWLKNQHKSAFVFFFLSLLSSEAFVVGAFVIIGYEFIFNKYWRNKNLITLIGLVGTFSFFRFILLTTKNTYDIYKPSISLQSFYAIKYYSLRMLGFGETSGDLLISLIIFVILGTVFFKLTKIVWENEKLKLLYFSLFLMIVGIFPFAFFPNHLSPHYLNISVFGFSILIGIALSSKNPSTYLILFLLFFSSLVTVYKYDRSSWVTSRARTARLYLDKISDKNPPNGSTLVFSDNTISSSYEAYISLGTGDALAFWFKDKNYKTCFSAFESCTTLP